MFPEVLPHFELDLEVSGESALAALAAGMADERAYATGWVHHPYAELHVPRERRHLWSPRLAVTVEEHGEGGTRLHGYFGPEPDVWTGFAAAYAALALVSIAAVFVAYAEMAVGHPPWALTWIGATLGGGVLLYLAALFGQRLGAAEMRALQTCLERALSRSGVADASARR